MPCSTCCATWTRWGQRLPHPARQQRRFALPGRSGLPARRRRLRRCRACHAGRLHVHLAQQLAPRRLVLLVSCRLRPDRNCRRCSFAPCLQTQRPAGGGLRIGLGWGAHCSADGGLGSLGCLLCCCLCGGLRGRSGAHCGFGNFSPGAARWAAVDLLSAAALLPWRGSGGGVLADHFRCARQP